jgi:hypothetical protein
MPRAKKTLTKDTATKSKVAAKEKAAEPVEEKIDTTSAPVTEPIAESEKVVEPKESERVYKNDDLIPCRSIISGYMNFKGNKSGTTYSWYDKGDISEVEYQDLRSAMISRSIHVMAPFFIIEDEELLNRPEWAGVKKVYENIYSKEDLAKILDLPLDHMARVVEELPVGAKVSLSTIVKAKIDDKSFDSMNKVKKLDELLGTQLALFLAED